MDEVQIMKNTDFSGDIINIFEGLKGKFKTKNNQYKEGDADSLANFRAGAMLQYGKDGLPEMYETLKGYMLKHVAYIYNHPLDGKSVLESLGDIAVYAAIGMSMLNRYQTGDASDKEGRK